MPRGMLTQISFRMAILYKHWQQANSYSEDSQNVYHLCTDVGLYETDGIWVGYTECKR
uniref:Uncharacterized protein n=1 Tax=viral metagenome TaxID=1070528 RepID=A0A6H1ZGV8_9ZZZZ